MASKSGLPSVVILKHTLTNILVCIYIISNVSMHVFVTLCCCAAFLFGFKGF